MATDNVPTPLPMKILIGVLYASIVLALTAALVFQFRGTTERALTGATWGLFAVILVWVVAARLWGRINPPAANEPSLSELLRSAANVVVTVDGVILGLIYTFAGNRTALPIAVKVGAMALVVGVILALLLYSLVAGTITSRPAVAFSTYMFSLTAWALSYGLLCIAFALVLPT